MKSQLSWEKKYSIKIRDSIATLSVFYILLSHNSLFTRKVFMKKLLTFALVAFGSYAIAIEKDETTDAMLNNAMTELCNDITAEECQDLRNEIESKLPEFNSYEELQNYLNAIVAQTKCAACQKQKEKQKQNAQ